MSTRCSSTRVRCRCLQEPDAEPRAFRRALDEPGNVGHHEAAMLADAHHAEIRVQRGERIIRDFRPRRRHRADERRLAGIRQPEQTHVRDHLQLELERALLARQARPELARRAIGARLEARYCPSRPCRRCATSSAVAFASRDRLAARRFRYRVTTVPIGTGNIEVLAAARPCSPLPHAGCAVLRA